MIELLLVALTGAQDPTRTDFDGDPLPPGVVARLGTARLRSSYGPMAFLPDGRRLLAGRKVWEVATGKLLVALADERTSVESFSIFDEGRKAVTGSLGGIWVWDLATGKGRLLVQPGPAFDTYHVVISPNGKTLASAGPSPDGTSSPIRLWDPDTGEEIKKLAGHPKSIFCLAISPDGRSLASGGEDDYVRIWDVATGEGVILPRGANGPSGITGVAFSTDGKLVAARSAGQRIFVWEYPASLEPRVFTNSESFALAPDGTAVALGHFGGGDCGISVRDLEGDRQRWRVPMQFPGASELAFSPDGKTLASSSGGILRLWDAKTGREITPVVGHTSGIHAVAFSSDGRRVTALDGEGFVRRWEATSGKLLGTTAIEEAELGANGSTTLSPDGTLLAGLTPDRRCLRTRTPEGAWKILESFEKEVGCIAFSPGGAWLVATSSQGIRIWSMADRKRLGTRDLLPGVHVETIQISEDARRILLTDRTTLSVMDVSTGKLLMQSDGLLTAGTQLRTILFSPDGKLVACYADPKGLENFEDPRVGIRLIDVATGQGLAHLPARTSIDRPAMAFSADGRYLAAGNSDGHAWVFEVATGSTLLHRERAHVIGFGALAFSPDATLLATAGDVNDPTILIHDLEPPERPDGLERAWEELAGPDGRQAHSAFCALVRAGDPAVALARERMPAATEEALRALLCKLDDDDPNVRDAGMLELTQRGHPADLRKMLDAGAKALSVDVRLRLQETLNQMDHPAPTSPALLRQLRLVGVLERVGTHAARELLEGIGTPGARAALGRLSRKS